MRKINKVFDLNSCIENLSYTTNGSSLNISFDNLNYGDIRAIKFKVQGYNSFNDQILADYYIVKENLAVKKNSKNNRLLLTLPEPEVKKVDLEIIQVCLEDGTIFRQEEKRILQVELEEYEYTDSEYSTVKKYFGKHAKYKPLDNKDFWICTCGRYNTESVCSFCNKNKGELFSQFDNIRELIVKNKNEKKRKTIIVTIIVIIIAFICGLFIHFVSIIGKKTFSTKTEMQQYIEGTYVNEKDLSKYIITYYSSNKQINLLNVKKDKVCDCRGSGISSGKHFDYHITKMNWRKGAFSADKKYYVKSDGNLQRDDETYVKISDNPKIESAEYIINNIEISDAVRDEDDNYNQLISFNVTNNSDCVIKSCTFKVNFSTGLYSQGTDETYDFKKGLKPNQTKKICLKIKSKYMTYAMFAEDATIYLLDARLYPIRK